MTVSCDNTSGIVRGIAVKTARGGPMRELESATAVVDGGLIENTRVSVKRGITFLDVRKWRAVEAELVLELPWHTRRANVLCEGLDLASLIGQRIQLGGVAVDIMGETEPCGFMERLQRGLYDALVPDCRGGVHGRVVRAGSFALGDAIKVLVQTNE